MEIPIYNNLKDFKENYLIDYSEKENTNFFKYLNQLHRNYIIIQATFEINNFCLSIINNIFEEFNKILKEFESTKITNNEYILNEKKSLINKYLKELEKNVKEYNLNEYYKEAIDNIKKYPSNYNREEFELILETLHEICDNFTDIIEFINEKIQDEKINLLRYSNNTNTNPTLKIENEIPEYDFSDNEDKVKLIILEKLGVIDYIKSIQQKPATISHTAEILSTFTGIKSGSLYTYLRPMICPVRDDYDKNSPYSNAENLPKANRQILKLKIIDANK